MARELSSTSTRHKISRVWEDKFYSPNLVTQIAFFHYFYNISEHDLLGQGLDDTFFSTYLDLISYIFQFAKV